VDHLFGYTGRAYDEETDLQNNHNRWYDAASGKWLSEDPIGFDGGDANLYRYVGNSPTLFLDPFGLEKILGIHSNAKTDGKFTSGHAWLSVYDTDTGQKCTYGLWPDSHRRTVDNGKGSDVRKDMELQDRGRFSRHKKLTAEQEKALAKYIKQKDAWSYTNTCAAWASQGFYKVTGEDVDPDDNLGFETPRELSKSIKALEDKDPTSAKSPGVAQGEEESTTY